MNDIFEFDKDKKVENIITNIGNVGYFPFEKEFRFWLLDIHDSLGGDFIRSRWKVYHEQANSGKPPLEQVKKTFELNNTFSLKMVNEALLQFYFVLLLGIFQRGTYGHHLMR